MTTIHNWKDISKLRPNARYRIEMEPSGVGAWIRPTREYYRSVKNEIWSKHNVYLASNIFSTSRRKWANDIFKKYGFDAKLSE